MEKEKIVEQLEDMDNAPTNSEIINSKKEVEEINYIDGSTGKFKSQSDLLKAYQNLEAEFTRKSQKLKELEKSLSESEDKQHEEAEVTPVYLNEDWSEKVSEFLTQNPNAKNYASEICEMVLNDKQIAESNCPLDTAWQKIATKNFVDKNSIISDSEFVENFILNNEKLIDKIVSKYISENLAFSSPVVISGESASEFSVAKKIKPKNFDEVKVEAEKIFN